MSDWATSDMSSLIKSGADILLDLRYKGQRIATYEFDNLQDANAFLITVKAEADKLANVAVSCSVTVSSELLDDAGSK